MTEKYMFFNSTASDRRRHQASDMADYWMSFLSTGLIHKDGEPFLKLEITEDKKGLYMTPGSAIINGHLYMNTDKLPIDLGTVETDTEYNVVLRWDNTIENRHIKIFVTEGELTRNEDVYELLLYKIKKSATLIEYEPEDITDFRLDEEVCGIASSLVSVPTEIFGEQWRDFVDEYYSWFEGIKNEMYATEKEVRQRDHALKREIAYLEMMMEAERRIKNGVVFADNFKGNPHNIEYLKGKAELAEDVEPNDRELKFRNAHDFHSDIKEITIYDQEKQERLQIDRIEEDIIYLSKPIVNGFEAQAMLFESVHQIEDGYMKVGEVPSGMTVEINNIDLGDIYDEWHIENDVFYLRKGDNGYIYDRNTNNLTLIGSNFIDAYASLIASRSIFRPINSGMMIFRLVRTNEIEVTFYKNGEEISFLEIDGRLSGSGSTNAVHISAINVGIDSIFVFANTNPGYFSYGKKVTWNGTELIEEDFRFTGTSDGWQQHSQITPIDGNKILMIRSTPNGKFVDTFDSNGNRIKTSNQMTLSTKLALSTFSEEHKVVQGDFTAMNDGFYTVLYFNDDSYALWRDDYYETFNDGKYSKVDIVTPYLWDLEKEKPFQLKSGRYADGRYFDGVIFEPKNADIRFKVPKTKEVVSYIENNGLGEYSGWFNQHSTADSNMDDEIQMIGTSSDDYDTFRLTVKRDSVDEDNRITRILGGVL